MGCRYLQQSWLNLLLWFASRARQLHGAYIARVAKISLCCLTGTETAGYGCRSRQDVSRSIVASGKKTDLKKQGLEGVKNAVVKNNLMGISPKMNKKGWVDSQGRKGKVRFLWFLGALQAAKPTIMPGCGFLHV